MNPWSILASSLVLLGMLECRAAAQEGVSPGVAPEIRFVENAGQWPESVRFAARGAGWRVHVDDSGWSLALSDCAGHAGVVRIRAREDSGDPPTGEDPGGARTRFFTDGRTCQRPEGARSFGRVRSRAIAPGVDLVLRIADGVLQYDLELAADACLEDVIFRVEGAVLEEVAADGTLTLITPVGPLVQQAPRAFEHAADGSILDCASSLVRLDAQHFALRVGSRREGLRLTVDPALVWSTYIGGGATQTVRAVADAGGGRTLIAGTTDSFDFPITPGVFDPNHNGGTDAFLTEFDEQGQILWSTFLGGLGLDEASALALDANGAITLAGSTRSSNFPSTVGAFAMGNAGMSDGFVARVSRDGTQLQWATYLGGAKHDEIRALAVDALGEVTVAGLSASPGFPTTPGAYNRQFSPGVGADAFVTRIFSSGSALVWSTFLGGNHEDRAEGVALDPSGAAWVAGSTLSPNFPRTVAGPSSGEDGFLSRIDASGSNLSLSIIVGGSNDDALVALVADGTGGAFAGGRTDSSNLPVTPGAFDTQLGGGSDGFLLHVDAAGVVHGCTYLGGGSSDAVQALSLTAGMQLLAAGETRSSDFPTTPGAYDRVLNLAASSSGLDGFVVELRRDLGQPRYSTFFGAGSDDRVLAVAALADGSVLLAGETTSYFFPTTPLAHRTSRGVLALVEGFSSRLALLVHPIPFGQGKQNSYGSRLSLSWAGFPSIQDNDFRWIVDAGIPNQPALVFYGTEAWSQAFMGGTLYIKPPIHRGPSFALDFVGYADQAWALPPAWVGRTMHAQAWCRDPGDLYGCGLSNRLQILIHP